MKMILNERKYIEDVLKSSDVNKNKSKDLALLIKYYYLQGKDKGEVRQSVEHYMIKHYPKYNPVLWDSHITKLVDAGKRVKKRKNGDTIIKELVEIDEICITKAEINKIKALRKLTLKKLAFGLLVYSKIHNQLGKNNTYWVNSELKDILSDCKIAVDRKKQRLMIHELINLGYLTPSNKVNDSRTKVNFANEDGEIVMTISDFDYFIYDYLKILGQRVKICKTITCDQRFIAKENGSLYCNKCKNRRNKAYIDKNNDKS